MRRVGDGRTDLVKLAARVARGELVAERVVRGLRRRLASITAERERLWRLGDDIEHIIQAAELERDYAGRDRAGTGA